MSARSIVQLCSACHLQAFTSDSACRILGSGNTNLPKVAAILMKVVARGTDLAEEDTLAKAAALLRQLQSTLPAEVSPSAALAVG